MALIREHLFRLRDILQKWVVPELRYSQTIYERHLAQYATGVGSWLDIGCGHQLLPSWRHAAEIELVRNTPFLVGVDYDFASLLKHRTVRNVVRADIRHLPFDDQKFDLVTANMVVEHLDDPHSQFCEIARVLRPGGVFLMHTPNLRSYVSKVAKLLPDAAKQFLARMLDTRASEDVFPTFYRANTDDSIEAIASQAGLTLVAVHYTASSPVFGVIPPLA